MKYVGIFLSMIIALVVVIPGAVAQSDTDFTDVSASHWAAGAIAGAVAKGYVSGYPDGTFRPEKEVSRAEFVTMLVLALKLPYSQGGKPWYQPYVAAAKELGILRDSDFDGDWSDSEVWNKTLTRIEMVRLEVRAADREFQQSKKEMDDTDFMYQAVSTGLISGVGGGELAPEGLSTRAQAVAVIERVLIIQSGGMLPVDAEALAAATEAAYYPEIPGDDIFERDDIKELSSYGWDYTVKDGSLLMNEHYTGLENYELDETLNPQINRQVYELTKVLIADDHYVDTRYTPDGREPLALIGLARSHAYARNLNYQFFWAFFEKNPFNLRESWNNPAFSDQVVISLDLGWLWDTPVPGHTIPFYTKKLKDACLVVFGRENGSQIYEFVLDKYIRSYDEDRSKQIRLVKVFQDVTLNYVYEGHGLCHFYFSYNPIGDAS